MLSLATKLTEKVPDPFNAKERYQSFIINKNTITYQPKTYENPNVVDMKSVITEHPKTSPELYKIIRQTEKVGLIALYILIQKKN